MSAIRDITIRRCRPYEDVFSFSECRNNLSVYINHVRETRRVIVHKEPIVSACGLW